MSERTSKSGRPLASTAFKKNESGNPGGWGAQKLRSYRELAAYIREKTRDGRDIVDACLRVLRSKKADERAVLLAARELFDRGFGKPVQTIDLNVDGPRVERESPKWDGYTDDEKRVLLEAADKLAALTDGDEGNGDTPTEH